MKDFFTDLMFQSFIMMNSHNDLNELLKLQNSNFKLDLKYFNLIGLVAYIFESMQDQAETKGVKLLLDFDVSKPFLFT